MRGSCFVSLHVQKSTSSWMVVEVLQFIVEHRLIAQNPGSYTCPIPRKIPVEKGHKRISGYSSRFRYRPLSAASPEHPSRLDLHIRMLLGRYLYLGLPLLQLTYALDAAGWRKQTIYQVSVCVFPAAVCCCLTSFNFDQLLTDRFAREDALDAPCDLPSRQYCGGTWGGLSEYR
jgi:hypothetical protein